MSVLDGDSGAAAEAPVGELLAVRRDQALTRALDFGAALAVLLLLAAPMLLIWLLVRSTSEGPAVFRQRRVGLGGASFILYKFRTMLPDADDAPLRALVAAELRGEDTAVDGSHKLADPRVTPIGRFLRRTSLDELPQLLNVLRGDMALVGPRPCLEWEARLFPAHFWPRFSVRPGLSGLWQVSGRSSLDTVDMLQLDLTYVRTRRLTGDLAILARTLPALLRDRTAR
ncbi:MAG TPA: sugar transferase [Pseudonocardia sp.]|jgi:lipopolysaccharide/colanic/teichoic acid biosynthesis glycosyltransferase